MPVWVVAAAKAATQVLLGMPCPSEQAIELPGEGERLVVSVKSAALVKNGLQAIGISYANSCLALDVTRNLEIWALVEWHQAFKENNQEDWLQVVAGTGFGTIGLGGEACMSDFAIQLLKKNLRSLVPKNKSLRVEIVFPKGKELAKRTSNASFGVVDGLALIGTQAEAHESASPEQLQKALDELRQISTNQGFKGFLTVVIGENGLDLAAKLGLASKPVIKSGNWLGPILVAAAELGVKQLLLLGYHGKLTKVAGGIFHTHHHLADARMEILIALAVREGLPMELIRAFSQEDSVQGALMQLETKDLDQARKQNANMKTL